MRKPEPTLIDLKTGEIIALGIFADVQEVADPGYITTGCFSLDDKYFYYNVDARGALTPTQASSHFDALKDYAFSMVQTAEYLYRRQK